MTRIPLKNDCCYKLKSSTQETEYRIVSHIGSGANTLVYTAEKEDNFGNAKRCILKEFYPERLRLSRDPDGKIIPEDAEKFEKHKNDFLNKNRQINNISASDDINGTFSVCHNNDFFEGNGTSYAEIPVESYQTYEDIKNERLSDMLKATCDICAVTGALHEAGYLHLDIKPSNLLCIEHSYEQRNTRILKFLDLDTVVKKENIRSNDVDFSYSEGYSAPEQKQFNLVEFSEKTDIFSIGAILFERIFGYLPSFNEMETDAEYDFDTDNELFLGVNVCFFDELTRFFKKTICCNPDNRFDSCIGDGDTVMKSLERLVVLAENRASASMHKIMDYYCPECRLVDEAGEYANDLLYPTVEISYGDHSSFFEKSLVKLFKRALYSETYSFGIKKWSDSCSDETNLCIAIETIKAAEEFTQFIKSSICNCRYLLTGSKESGKSFALKKLYNDIRDKQLDSAPIYISVNTLSETESLTDRILTEYFGFGNISGVKSARSELEKAFSDIGKIEGFPAYTLMIDGLNEASPDKRKKLAEELNSFSKFENLFVIVASTDYENNLKIATTAEELSNNPGSFVEIKLQSLSQAQIRKYISQKNSYCADKLDERSLFKILGNNIRIVKMLSELDNVEYVECESDIIRHYLDRITTTLEKNLIFENNSIKEIDCRKIFELICKKMLKNNTNVIYKSDFKEILNFENTVLSEETIFEEFSKCGVFLHQGKGRLFLSSSLRDYIIAKSLKSELEKICNATCDISPDNDFLIGSRSFNINTLTYLSELTSEKEILADGENGRIISDSYISFFDCIKKNQDISLEHNPHYLLTFAFIKIHNVKYKQFKAMAAINILKAMQIARNGAFFIEEKTDYLKTHKLNADFSVVKTADFAKDYYGEMSYMFKDDSFSSVFLKRFLLPLASATLILFLAFYAVPHLLISPPDVGVSALHPSPETLTDWSEQTFTIVDVNQTSAVSRAAPYLNNAFDIIGFSGEIVLDEIIDANTATMRIKVDKITDEHCFVILKKGVLESIGSFNVVEGNEGKLLFAMDAVPNTQTPVIGVSVNGKKVEPGYVCVQEGDMIGIEAIAPEDDSIAYLEYKLGTDDVVTVEGDYTELIVPNGLSEVSLQVFAETEKGKYRSYWVWYTIVVLPPVPPTIEISVNGKIVPDLEEATVKRNDYIKVKVYPSKTTGAEIERIEYKLDADDVKSSTGDTLYLKVPDDCNIFTLQIKGHDINGLESAFVTKNIFYVEE